MAAKQGTDVLFCMHNRTGAERHAHLSVRSSAESIVDLPLLPLRATSEKATAGAVAGLSLQPPAPTPCTRFSAAAARECAMDSMSYS
jgi:hypothetical protein